MQHQYARACWISLLLVGFTLLLGCDTSLQPIDEDTGLFSIYGYLTLSNRPHYIRIRNLKDPVFDGSDAGIPATVTLEHLETGTTETLDDSIVVFQGVQTHNFKSSQDIQPDDKYRIVVERSDGASTQVTATMPELTNVGVDPSAPIACTEDVTFTFFNVPEPRLLKVSVGFLWRGQWHWVERGNPTISPEGTPMTRFSPEGILREVVPERILRSLGPPSEYCTLMVKKEVRVAYSHFGPDWPADSVLTNPVKSQVENGLGVFGGLHRDTLVKNIEIPE